MRKKKFDECREFGCSRKTHSGKPEKDINERYCVFHSPRAVAQRAAFTEKAIAKLKKDVVVRKIRVFPLACVFKRYDNLENPLSGASRVIYAKDICGKPAPRRRRGDQSLPRFPNRFGEPLCEEHAAYAHDEIAFPGDVTETFTSERDEENLKRIERIASTLR